MAYNFKDIMNDNSNDSELFNKVTDYSIDKEIEEGFENLSTIEKNLFMIGKLLLEVNNGGFDQYFLNTEGKYAKGTIKFLNSIGESNFSKLFCQATDILYSDLDEDEKYEEFEELDIEFFNFDREYNKLYEKCIQYVKNNLD